MIMLNVTNLKDSNKKNKTPSLATYISTKDSLKSIFFRISSIFLTIFFFIHFFVLFHFFSPFVFSNINVLSKIIDDNLYLDFFFSFMLILPSVILNYFNFNLDFLFFYAFLIKVSLLFIFFFHYMLGNFHIFGQQKKINKLKIVLLRSFLLTTLFLFFNLIFFPNIKGFFLYELIIYYLK